LGRGVLNLFNILIGKNIIIILVVLLSACASKKTFIDVAGEYQSKKYNFVQQIYMGYVQNRTYPLRSSIFLNRDSTFIEKNCGNTAKGIWLLKNDTIIMETFSNRFNNDSLNKARGPLKTAKKGPRYLVDKNELNYLYIDTFMGKKIIHTLVKVK